MHNASYDSINEQTPSLSRLSSNHGCHSLKSI
jgi:hypothetical protein